ncbi:alpha/beta fold hydrolase [Halococcus sediminicola]|uniref:alpha/beta fold hydrolase n=1 Tax=Halococcus sediminicola TaxID=1264579 RepID=UPI001377468D|nr:alpha/beta hydrolase [Halococcus sediminicola]
MPKSSTVKSTDGTEIAYRQGGNGPPLILIHGGGLSGQTLWDTMQPQFISDTTLLVPDRRGHGDSGDTSDYNLEQEVADIHSIIESVGSNPTLFGHSYGGLCALEAAREATVKRLILYEPAILTGEHKDDANLSDEMEKLLDAGERRQAVKQYLRESAGLENIERLPIWPEIVNHAKIIVRQNRAIEQYRLEDLDISVPTLLLRSEEGPEHLRDGVGRLHETLPNSQLVELKDMGHNGVYSNSEQVANEIWAFMQET